MQQKMKIFCSCKETVFLILELQRKSSADLWPPLLPKVGGYVEPWRDPDIDGRWFPMLHRQKTYVRRQIWRVILLLWSLHEYRVTRYVWCRLGTWLAVPALFRRWCHPKIQTLNMAYGSPAHLLQRLPGGHAATWFFPCSSCQSFRSTLERCHHHHRVFLLEAPHKI